MLVGQVSNLTQSDEKTKQVLCSELDEFGLGFSCVHWKVALGGTQQQILARQFGAA